MGDWRSDICADASVSDQAPRPNWVGVIPKCNDRCPFFDGKRCELLGLRPSRICEPVVLQMGVQLNRARGGDDGQA